MIIQLPSTQPQSRTLNVERLQRLASNGRIVKMSNATVPRRHQFNSISIGFMTSRRSKKVWRLKSRQNEGEEKRVETCVRADVMTNEFQVEREIYHVTPLMRLHHHRIIFQFSFTSPINKRSLHKFFCCCLICLLGVASIGLRLVKWTTLPSICCDSRLGYLISDNLFRFHAASN